MIDVQVTIDGIVLYCDESVSALQLGNGYRIQKTYLDDLPFKNKINDGNGIIFISYLGSKRQDEIGAFFMCLHKEDTHQVQMPQITPGVRYTDRDFMREEQLTVYKDNEMEFLHKTFSLLRVFKKGNIGCKEIFLEHRFTVMGFINNTCKQTSDNVTRNIIDNTIFSLTPEEVISCNQFLQDYAGREYTLLKSCIDEFVWGLEQVDIPTGFEQYTTALEMLLLEKNQQGKKEVLSKRVAVLLESNPIKVRVLYDKMKNYYRYRSESLHEGDGRNISGTEMSEMQEIVRGVLLKYLGFCKVVISNNPSVAWDTIKENKINDLKATVAAAISAGTLPT
ncbi:MAG: hypothetical protein K0S61_3387 [Anaerocolumna sp.]|nr:hypothetical protein [Anaerocolumna sp.]